MKKQSFFLLFSLISMFSFGQSQDISLDSIIATYENHKEYDWKEYPLGRHDEALAMERAGFFKSITGQAG